MNINDNLPPGVSVNDLPGNELDEEDRIAQEKAIAVARSSDFRDRSDNRLSIREGRIVLHLNSEVERRHGGRHVGDFFARSRTFYKKENEKGIFRKFNAFGFCHAAIKLTDPAEIVVDYKGDRYTISRTMFEAVKKYLHFKDEGFELRVYIPLTDFKKGKK